MNENLKMSELIAMMEIYHNTDSSPSRTRMYAEDLKQYSLEQISDAWRAYRNVPGNNRLPSPSDLKFYIQDGRPNAQEAWAMMPWSEDTSVVWTEEMRAAWSIAAPLVDQKQNANAFFAFKDTYNRLLMEARERSAKPKWTVSLGFSVSGREAALKEAVEKGRMSLESARNFVPELPAPQQKTLALPPAQKQNIEKLNQLTGGKNELR